jgi:hypothetical protein
VGLTWHARRAPGPWRNENTSFDYAKIAIAGPWRNENTSFDYAKIAIAAQNYRPHIPPRAPFARFAGS